jgi:hypothetical protein
MFAIDDPEPGRVELMNKMGFLDIKIQEEDEYKSILVVIEGQSFNLYRNQEHLPFQTLKLTLVFDIEIDHNGPFTTLKILNTKTNQNILKFQTTNLLIFDQWHKLFQNLLAYNIQERKAAICDSQRSENQSVFSGKSFGIRKGYFSPQNNIEPQSKMIFHNASLQPATPNIIKESNIINSKQGVKKKFTQGKLERKMALIRAR